MRQVHHESTCQKRTTIVELYDQTGNLLSRESNRCNPTGGTCHRLGLVQTKEGYDIHSHCNWTHAEVNALAALPAGAIPYRALLYGHSFYCDNCEGQLRKAGVQVLDVAMPYDPANEEKTILIYCEESGGFAQLYRQAGYNVIVRDLMLNPEHDIRKQPFIMGGVYGFLGFPPCTHLAGSGARWWAGKGEGALLEALGIADACLRAVALYKPRFWWVENPVGRLSRFWGKPKFTFHPYEYGGYIENGALTDGYTKRTCLWGEFTIPEKKPVEPILGGMIHRMPPSEGRAMLRSKTPAGFARAFFLSNQ